MATRSHYGDVLLCPSDPGPDDHYADLALTKAAAGGDAGARLCLADRLLDRVQATAYFMSGGLDHEDLVQDSLVEILSSLRSFRGESRLETWADRIAVRTIRRAWGRRGHAPVLPLIDPDSLPSNGAPSDRLAQLAELRRRLALALGRLTPERREAFVLFAVHRYTAAEISELTTTPVNTVRDRIKVAKRQLENHARRDPVLREWLDGGAHEP